MSEVKVQDSPAVPSGAQRPLSADLEQKNRSGFVGNQNQHKNAIGRGVEVNLSATSAAVKPNIEAGEGQRESASVSQMGCNGIAVNVKPVDRRTIEGSYSGDSRAKGSPAVLPANPGPREQMTQAPFSGKR
ncbi:MAG TPA: hypothetical protein VMP68_02395 [Candidatus Eisenbacteria bacterium]|nr:hypothetical protein [Candidatus Eisenbacteria bacterium]